LASRYQQLLTLIPDSFKEVPEEREAGMRACSCLQLAKVATSKTIAVILDKLGILMCLF